MKSNAPRSVVNPLGCGVQPVHFNLRISEGQEAAIGQFPWIAFLDLKHKDTFEPNRCGATLITWRHLITAGHCVYQQVLNCAVKYDILYFKISKKYILIADDNFFQTQCEKGPFRGA